MREREEGLGEDRENTGVAGEGIWKGGLCGEMWVILQVGGI